MIKLQDTYLLPDISILDSVNDFDYYIWNPDKLYIVLGRSDDFESAVVKEQADENNATVVKRPSGGHSVILSEKTIVVSLLFKTNELNTKEIFKKSNAFIIDALTKLGVDNITEKGISDICIGNKKILGSSIYKKSDKVFYHAVINHSEDVNLIQNLLKHPKKEPDYRAGRNHKDFVTSIEEQGYFFSIDEFKEQLTKILKEYANE